MFEKILDSFGDYLEDQLIKIKERDDMIVEKTVPMKPKWKKDWENLCAVTEQQDEVYEKAKAELDAIEKKRETLHGKLWSSIKDELGIYDQLMRYNNETNEIEVLQEKPKEEKTKEEK